MAAGSLVLYGAFFENLAKGLIDLDGHTFKAMLLSTYTPDDDSHATVSDVSGTEVSSGTFPDYARVTLGSPTVSRSAMEVKWVTAAADFGATVTIDAGWLVIYDDTHASDALVGYADLNTGGLLVSSVDGPFVVSPHATNGWATFGPPA